MRINAISIIPFQKKVRISNDENKVDKTLQASALTGLYTTAGAVGAGILGTDIASTAFSLDSMGTNSSDIVPTTIEVVKGYSPAVARSSANHPSSVSTGLYSTRDITQKLNLRTTNKVIPSLENQIKGEQCEQCDETEFAPFEYVGDGEEKEN